MERKTFLATAAGAATVGALTATPAQARLDESSDRNIRFMMKIINAVIEDLNQDAHDYGGYRGKAIANLESAVDNLRTGLKFEETR